jgi:calcineurin-like phosphoesterase family protein
MFNTQIKEILDMIDENTRVISDTHFGHENILTFEPIRNTTMRIDGYENHDQWLIDNWNSSVKPDDVVLHLGDFAFKMIQDVQHLLNGRKILILGNHDRKGIQTYNAFEHVIRGLWVQRDEYYLGTHTTDELFSVLIKEINGKKVMFSHYPVDEREIEFDRRGNLTKRIQTCKDLYYSYECEINVHGHTHSNLMQDRDTRKFKNVCVEHIGFIPKKLKDIL